MQRNDLTDNEFTVLMIAAADESMIPIGRWKEPVERLAARGLLHRHNEHNYAITETGRQALKAREDEDATALITAFNPAASGVTQIREIAEQAAQQLAEAARRSQPITGDDPVTAARKWSEIILNRALELLGERR